MIVPDTGSGYGGKHTGEAAVEAARLAKAAGKPVKLVWTREEEFTWAYFRPAGRDRGQRRRRRRTARSPPGSSTTTTPAASAIRTPYDVPNRKTEFHASDSPLRQGSYRALASTANNFARESHHGRAGPRGRDGPARVPAEEPEGRSGCGRCSKRPRSSSAGARRSRRRATASASPCGTEKGSYVATCAEVAVDQASGRFASSAP